MRKPLPPKAYLSAEGNHMATTRGFELTLIDVARGEQTVHEMPHGVGIAALSPSGRYVAAAGDSEISICCYRPTFSILHTFGFAMMGRLIRLQINGKGVAAAVETVPNQPKTLHIWSNDSHFTSLADQADAATFKDTGLEEIEDVAVNSSQNRLLVWGRAHAGSPSAFLFRLDSQEKRLHTEWQGNNAPLDVVDGYLLPDQNKTVLCYNWQKAALFSIEGEAIRLHSQLTFDTPENIAISPDGQWLGWTRAQWTGAREQFRLKVVSLRSEKREQEYRIEKMGRFPSLALDSDARPTLVYAVSDDTLHLLRPAQNGLALHSEHKVR